MQIESLTLSRTAELYRDYLNNFLTVEVFAEHYGLTVWQAYKVIEIGRFIHNQGL